MVCPDSPQVDLPQRGREDCPHSVPSGLSQVTPLCYALPGGHALTVPAGVGHRMLATGCWPRAPAAKARSPAVGTRFLHSCPAEPVGREELFGLVEPSTVHGLPQPYHLATAMMKPFLGKELSKDIVTTS